MTENENELVQYFLVNKDLGMKKGKIAAQVAHAATIYTRRMLENCNTSRTFLAERERFEQWYYSVQKKIIVKAPQEMMERYEKSSIGYISIRDKGYTQIPENSLTVITLGVQHRGCVNEEVRNLPLL